MAAKKTAAEQGLQQKMKVLAKLFDAGCKTEKDLKAYGARRLYLRSNGAALASDVLFHTPVYRRSHSN